MRSTKAELIATNKSLATQEQIALKGAKQIAKRKNAAWPSATPYRWTYNTALDCPLYIPMTRASDRRLIIISTVLRLFQSVWPTPYI